jgi:transposase
LEDGVMGQRFVSGDRDQVWLLPPSMRDWLPENHLAWFVLGLVDEFDLQAFYAVYRQDGQGRAAFDPAVMVALLVYSYAVGVQSSRRIERRCVEDVATRVVAGNLCPDHVTIARFRARHQDALAGLFSQVLGLCARAGLVDSGTVAIDGTKLRANASVARSMTSDGLRKEAERILKGAAEIDAAEDREFGDRRGDELPPELADPRTRAARIRELLGELQAEQDQVKEARARRADAYEQAVKDGRPPTGRPVSRELSTVERRVLTRKVNVTDPDSRIVRDKGAMLQGYNAQAVVGRGQIVIAARIASGPVDQTELTPMIAAGKEELERAGIDQPIRRVLADTGYWNSAQMTQAHQAKIETIVPTSSSRNGARNHRWAKRKGPHAARIDALLNTPEGKEVYRARQQIVEPVFAHIKHLRGIRSFARRGRAAVHAEWQLIAATHNILKLHRAQIAAT